MPIDCCLARLEGLHLSLCLCILLNWALILFCALHAYQRHCGHKGLLRLWYQQLAESARATACARCPEAWRLNCAKAKCTEVPTATCMRGDDGLALLSALSLRHCLLFVSGVSSSSGSNGASGEACEKCSRPCEREHSCGHGCPLPCHPDPCPPCQLESAQACHCGRSLVPVVCHQLQQVQHFSLLHMHATGDKVLARFEYPTAAGMSVLLAFDSVLVIYCMTSVERASVHLCGAIPSSFMWSAALVCSLCVCLHVCMCMICQVLFQDITVIAIVMVIIWSHNMVRGYSLQHHRNSSHQNGVLM